MIERFQMHLCSLGLTGITRQRYCRWVQRYISWCNNRQLFCSSSVDAFLVSPIFTIKRNGDRASTSTQNDAFLMSW